VLLAAVVALALHLGEVTELARLLRELRPAWILAGALLQAATYYCAAGIWQLALARQGYPVGVHALVPMALAMLFTNQALPSGGVSGSVVVVRALRRRQLPAPAVMGALLVGLVTTYHAYLAAVCGALVILAARHSLDATLATVAGTVALAAIGMPTFVLWYWRARTPALRRRIGRITAFARVLDVVEATPTTLLEDRGLWVRAIGLQLFEMALDAATLYTMLVAINVPASPAATLAAFVMASAVARVVPVPLGLGTFEGAMIAMLHLVGVPIEAALAGTLLLRGFTMWLPMAPGLWFARREL